MFEIRKNLDLRKILVTPKIFLKSRFHCIKFIYSEKATKFQEIFTLLLTTVHTVKSKVNISQNFVAFSEYMNFKKLFDQLKSNFFLVIKWAPVYSRDYATHFLASNTLKNKEFWPKGPHFSSYFTTPWALLICTAFSKVIKHKSRGEQFSWNINWDLHCKC